MNRTLSKLMLLFIILQVMFGAGFGRFFFLNEALSFVGACIAVRSISMRINKANFIIYTFVMYGVFYLVAAVMSGNSIYYSLRNFQVIYSAFVFFCGAYAFRGLNDMQYIFGVWYKYLFLLLTLGLGLTHRLVDFIVSPLFFIKNNVLSIYKIVLVYLLVHFFIREGATQLLALFFVATLYFMVAESKLRYFMYLIFISGFIFLFWIFLDCKNINNEGLIYVYKNYGFLAFDPNLIIRVYFWAVSVYKIIASGFVGVGIGNELFYPWQITLTMSTEDETDALPYLLWPHNSILGVAVRYGIFQAYLIICLMIVIYKEFFKLHRMGGAMPMTHALAIAMALSCSSLLLNVNLESPLRAASFWAIAGIFYAAIRANKLAMRI